MRYRIRTVWLVLALALAATASAQATAPEGYDPVLWAEGQRAFTEIGGMGCAGCHGRFGANELGGTPVIRGVEAERIHGALQGMQAMVFLQPLITPAEVDAIAYYLGYLDTMVPVVVNVRRGAFEPTELTIPASTHIQLILSNLDRAECLWTVEGADVEPVAIPGRGAIGAVDFTTAASGTYRAFCAGAPDTAVTITIE